VIRDCFAEELGISSIAAQVLINRGLDTVSKAQEFLNPDPSMLHDPFVFSDMGQAVGRVFKAINNHEKILVYGDYDVDGITSISVLLPVLRELGAEADYYIPNRVEEGYGLNMPAVRAAAESGVRLIITVDCGIAAHAEIQYAADLGMEVIITDHHEPPRILPDACALINPKIPDCSYPFADLAGVGVAFKLAQALLIKSKGEESRNDALDRYLDLVALGTIADVVPLLGENRVIVKFGLEKLSETRNVGLQALIRVSGLLEKKMDPVAVGYSLAPRINAVGRIGDPGMGVELLLTSQVEHAERLARSLDAQNRERKEQESQILEDALDLICSQVDLDTDRVIVLAGKGWHTGIVGIVASRICEMYYRPTILISVEEDEARGSARSIEEFHIYHALSKCSDNLLRFGGHEQAAGLAICPERIDEFRRQINAIANEVLHGDDLIPKVNIDCRVDLDSLSFNLLDDLDVLGPFGMKNPEPLFCLSGIKVAEYRPVGEGGRHLKLKVRSDSATTLDAIGFDMGEYCNMLFESSGNIDVVFSLNENTWNGRTSLQLRLADIRKGGDIGSYSPSIRFAREHDENSSLALHEVKELVDDILSDSADINDLLLLTGVAHLECELDGPDFKTILEELSRRHIVVNKTLLPWNDGFYASVCGIFAGIRLGGPIILVCPSLVVCRKVFHNLKNLLGHIDLKIDMLTNRSPIDYRDESMRLLSQDVTDVLVVTEGFFVRNMAGIEVYGTQPSVLVVFENVHNFGLCREPRRLSFNPFSIRQALGNPGLLIITDRTEDSPVEVPETQNAVIVDKIRQANLPQSRLIDRRDERDKLHVVDTLLEQGKRLLIYVASPESADKLARILKSIGEGRRILYYHEGLSGEDRLAISCMLEEGVVDVLVATSLFYVEGSNRLFSDVLIFDAPSDLVQLRLQCLAASSSNVHFLFNKEDMGEILELVDREFPDREQLAMVYIALKRILRGSRVFSGSIGDVLEFCDRFCEFQLELKTFLVGLEVFRELNLVRSTIRGEDLEIEFQDNNGEKVKLEDSLCYMEGALMREWLVEWAENLHNLDIKSIMKLVK
jgi:single-stranded-DNA-specific exonuclease RecJ